MIMWEALKKKENRRRRPNGRRYRMRRGEKAAHLNRTAGLSKLVITD